MSEKITKMLQNSEESFPDTSVYRSQLMDQYKLYVEMADRVSARRQTANTYFLSINTGLLGFVGYVSTKELGSQLWMLGVAGALLCYLWYRIILAYKGLNSGKFKVVHLIEKKLPLNLFDTEWEMIGRGTNPKLYKPLTHVEMIVPWLFMSMHLAVATKDFPMEKISQLILKIF